MSATNVKDIVQQLLNEHGRFQSGQVAARAGLTRQAVHAHLRRLVEAGLLRREGLGRGAHYVSGSDARALTQTPKTEPPWQHRFRFPRAGLEEDQVWRHCVKEVPFLATLPPAAEAILHYGVTELVNNAIDHSGASLVQLGFSLLQGRVQACVEDDGEGLFEHLRKELGLADSLAALQEVSKGKVTTAPQAHTGQGLFFTSKAVDVFVAESGELRWVVDNLRHEVAWGACVPAQSGTRLLLTLERETTRSLPALFDEYTDEDLAFSRSRAFVRLFEVGSDFVSRSEAKRLLSGLERFRDVVVDFQGVHTVGQGFADEVFRVWAKAHPRTALHAENMNPAVAAMVGRARR